MQKSAVMKAMSIIRDYHPGGPPENLKELRARVVEPPALSVPMRFFAAVGCMFKLPARRTRRK